MVQLKIENSLGLFKYHYHYFFKKQYSKNDKAIDLKSDGKDYSNVDFGEHVGDKKNEGWDIYIPKI